MDASFRLTPQTTTHRRTKALVALAGAALLLIGGRATLAVWTESEPVTGGALNAGHLNLVTDGVNTGCGAWTLDTGESAPSTYNAGDPLVPGDVLTKTCSFTIEAEGNHLRAAVGLGAANFSGADGDFGGALVADVSDVSVGGVPATEFTEDNDGDALTAVVTVTFDGAAGNSTEDLSTVLDTVSLTATQVHD